MKYTLSLLLVIVVLSASGIAHKNAAEDVRSDYSYYVSFGMDPLIVVNNEPQRLFIRVEDYYGSTPITDLRARFVIYHDRRSILEGSEKIYMNDVSELVGNYEAVQNEYGVYSIEHTFEEKGNYIVEAKLYDGRKMIYEINKNMIVEPKGPSVVFWGYMLLALIAGGIVASRSHLD